MRTLLCFSLLLFGVLQADVVWSEDFLLTNVGLPAFDPAVGVDDTGDAVAVWYRLKSAVDTNSQVESRSFDWQTETWNTVQVLSDNNTTNARGTKIAVNSPGNAIAVWYDQGEIPVLDTSTWAANYVKTTNTWTNIELDAEDSVDPNVAIDDNGDGIVVWYRTDLGGVYARSYTQATNTWSAIATLSATGDDTTGNGPSVGVDSNGDGLAVWRDGNAIFAATYTRVTNTWSAGQQISDATTQSGLHPAVSVNAIGDAVAMWEVSISAGISAAAYTKATNTWTTPIRISNDGRDVVVGIDGNGDAVSVWNDSLVERIDASSYTRATNTWTTPQTISSGPETLANFAPSITVNTAGNAIAFWGIDENVVDEVFISNEYSKVLGTWSNQQHATNIYEGLEPRWDVDMNDRGQAVGVFDNLITTNPPLNTAVVGEVHTLFAAPPNSISGQRLINEVCSQSEHFNRISWTAGENIEVIGYRIYKNNVLIATVSPSTRSYEDHNIVPGTTFTYGVATVNADGSESARQTITL